MSRYSRIILVGLTALFLAACAQAATPAPTSAPTSVPTSAPTSAAAATVQRRTDAQLVAELGRYLTTLSGDRQFSGIVTVKRDQAIVFQKGYGFADRAKQIPFSPQTVFRIGEMSMQFTAAATLLLEQQKKLTVHDSLCTYIERCPEAWKPVTLHHLLSHTSGIPDYTDMDAGTALRKTGATTDQILGLIRDKPLELVPGSKRVYSRSGFVLLGLVIERVSGQPYGDFMRQQIFQPLGMQHSGYGDPPDGLAIGYSGGSDQQVNFNVSALAASGGIYTTSEDMLRWIEGLYGAKLLDAAQLEKMLTPHARFVGDDGHEWGSGYGIVLDTMGGHQRSIQAGTPPGYTACAGHIPDAGVSVVVLANQDNVDFTTITDRVFKSALGIS
jgi:CubicO group peptidase (beta-lactamase class C family)